jgi:hypothetical protein
MLATFKTSGLSPCHAKLCPRLPDMLGAIKDIVMKRGFNEIVADEFREVLKRLPPAQSSNH